VIAEDRLHERVVGVFLGVSVDRWVGNLVPTQLCVRPFLLLGYLHAQHVLFHIVAIETRFVNLVADGLIEPGGGVRTANVVNGFARPRFTAFVLVCFHSE